MVENNTIYHLILIQSHTSVQNILFPRNTFHLTLDSSVIIATQIKQGRAGGGKKSTSLDFVFHSLIHSRLSHPQFQPFSPPEVSF